MTFCSYFPAALSRRNALSRCRKKETGSSYARRSLSFQGRKPKFSGLWIVQQRPSTREYEERIVSKRNRSNRNEKLPALFAPIMQPKLVQFVSGLLRSLTTRTHPYEELHDSTKLQDMV